MSAAMLNNLVKPTSLTFTVCRLLSCYTGVRQTGKQNRKTSLLKAIIKHPAAELRKPASEDRGPEIACTAVSSRGKRIYVQTKTRIKILRTLTLVGCFSTGIIYVSIGIIAILSFLKLKDGGADESSFFVLLNGFVVDRIVNWAIIVGALCFIIWRFYEAIKDPHHTGKDAKAILLRMGGAFSSAADAFIALSVLGAMFGKQKVPVSGEPIQQRDMVAHLLQLNGGSAIVMAAGIVVLVTSIVLVFYGFSSKFAEAIRSKDFSRKQKTAIHIIAYAGYFARGVILGIIGFFYIMSAIERNGRYVVNTDKAFDFIGDHIGHPWFILVAIGTVAYGVYMFILGLHYDIR